MSIMDTISKPENRAMIATICGDGGLGKTSLASTFPKPIFIRAEDGLQAIPEATRPDAFPVIGKVGDLWDQLTSLIKEDHDYQTLVIDSVTALDPMFNQYVVDNDPNTPKSINQALGGYGAGLAAVAAMHQRLRKAAGVLNANKGMNIVFIAHADTETMDLPDTDGYTRYTLRLGKKCIAPYTDNVDLVGFIKLETHLKGKKEERKRAISDGSRVMVTYATASNVSKNRFGIIEDIPVVMGENPLAAYLPTKTTKGKTK